MVAITLVLAILSVTDGAIDYRSAVSHMHDQRDRALGRIAASYLRSLRAQDSDTSKIPSSVFQEELGQAQAPQLRFRVNDEHGDYVGGDPRLQPPPSDLIGSGVVQADVYDDTMDGQKIRIAVVRDYLMLRAQAQAVVVQVAEPLAYRLDAQRDILWQLVRKQALRLCIVLALVWLVIDIGLSPLRSLHEEIKRRRPQDLTPLNAHRPSELVPLVKALNDLLSAQQASLDQQRKFLADASHQLRTPIAVLRTLLQGTLFGQTPAAESMPKMLNIIDRATGLTNQLLSMAKSEQLLRRGDWQAVQLEEVARNVTLEFAPLIARKRLDFSLQAKPLTLFTDPWLLGELVKNLVSNAIHHSRKGAAMGIVVRELKHEAEMIVWDHGGGVSEDVLERLFEPFNVAKGSSGIGLGLSICRQIAESMNASVNLFNRIEGGRIVGVDAVVRWSRPQTQPEPGEAPHGLQAISQQTQPTHASEATADGEAHG